MASAEVNPVKSTVSLRTMLSSLKPSKSNVRLKVIGETVGVLTAVAMGVGSGVAVGGTGVGTGVGGTGVGTGVGITTEVGEGGNGVEVGAAVGTRVAVGVCGTGVYLARISTHPEKNRANTTGIKSKDVDARYHLAVTKRNISVIFQRL